MERKIYLDLDLCIGCRSCEAACFAHFNESRINISELKMGTNIPLACRQCEDALCMNSCPADALTRDENGIVLRSAFHCIGCRSCIIACPFGVMPEPLDFHVSQKCNYCSDRNDGPRCVAACPTDALKFLDRTEVEKIETGVYTLSKSPFYRRSR